MPIVINHLQTLFHRVVHAVTKGKPDQWGQLGRNPKGDQVKWFDLAADLTVCAYLEAEFPYPVRLLSEEGEPRQFGQGEPAFTMVLDPVDGSENFSRELDPAAMAIALIPANMPIAVGTVQFGLVGNLFSGKIWIAERGQGAFCDGKAVNTSDVRQVAEALLSCDLNKALVNASFASLLASARGVRACGAATLDLARVASGVFDAHLDIRGRLTPENFLASALIITEAGGLISDPRGNSLPPIESLTSGYGLVASATPQLHQAIIDRLDDSHPGLGQPAI